LILLLFAYQPVSPRGDQQARGRFSHKLAKDKVMSSAYETFLERYESGRIPWNHELPPPEVIALVVEMEPGRGLDLGCGYGRTALYLAQKGWQTDGVDFIAQAIAEAQRRADEEDIADRACFHHGSVADLHFLTADYDLAIDVGCMHSLTADDQRAYRDELLRLLATGGIYLLFAHLQDEGEIEAEDKPRGISEAEITELFASGFVLERVERGWTEVEDKPAWRSGWFWFRRV
jgi:cyclopropane fatty-acyl-phospholipid synthase-like methyltransferase